MDRHGWSERMRRRRRTPADGGGCAIDVSWIFRVSFGPAQSAQLVSRFFGKDDAQPCGDNGVCETREGHT